MIRWRDHATTVWRQSYTRAARTGGRLADGELVWHVATAEIAELEVLADQGDTGDVVPPRSPSSRPDQRRRPARGIAEFAGRPRLTARVPPRSAELATGVLGLAMNDRAAPAPSSLSPAKENAADGEARCEATLDGVRRCIRRGPHKLHRWESKDGAQRFDRA